MQTHDSLWDRYFLPWATDLFTRSALRFRKQVLPEAAGRVLEVGIGSGPGLERYGPDVTELVGLEPNPVARQNLAKYLEKVKPPFRVDVADGLAAPLSFADASFDTVSYQLVLCTVPDPVAALQEAKRVLKPGGKLLFIEHVRHSHPRTAKVQDWITPMWAKFAGGCRLNQDTLGLIEEAGFRVAWSKEVENEMRPHMVSHMIWGVAQKRIP